MWINPQARKPYIVNPIAPAPFKLAGIVLVSATNIQTAQTNQGNENKVQHNQYSQFILLRHLYPTFPAIK
jgi:hypothetical protein